MQVHDTDHTANCKAILCDSTGNEQLMEVLNDAD